MLQVLKQWYERHFSDPQVVLLALLLIFGFALIFFAGHVLAPIFASIVFAYLLDGAVVRLEKRGMSHLAASVLVFSMFVILLVAVLIWLLPLMFNQLGQFIAETPDMINRANNAILQLPKRYPEFVSDADVEGFMATARMRIGGLGDLVLSRSISSIDNLITLAVYLILVPVLIFFFIKDKWKILQWFASYLPVERELTMELWREMNLKIASYVRGKFTEIMIIWGLSFITFYFLGLNYAMLLALLVGLSVIIPYVGAASVTVPVLLIAYFQWGFTSEFYYVAIAYAVIQFLDANVIVPVLFSEAVNLHPIAIITAILVFGSIWGIWGVFFAIPLATLVDVVLDLWPKVSESPPDDVVTTE